MNPILDFLNQPIVLTLITIAIGSFILNFVTERRAKETRLTEQKIEFITEASDNINQILPHLNRQLRTGQIETNQAISDSLVQVLSKRLTIQIRSQAYLKSDDFYQRYNRLIDEIIHLVVCQTEFEQDPLAADTIAKVIHNRQILQESWPLTGEQLNKANGLPADELLVWLDMIMNRTIQLLSSYLKSALQ